METTATILDSRADAFKDYLHHGGIVWMWLFIVLSVFLTLTPFRLLPYIFLLVWTFLWFRRPQLRRARFLAAVLGIFLAMQFLLPFDVSMLYRPGVPRFTRVQMGRPRPEAVLAAKRGEVVLGGCFVTGNEPAWTLVW